MTKYKNIGDYLYYEFIVKYGINQLLLSTLIKVHPNRINEIIRHKRTVTIDTDLRLCKFFKLEDGHFFNLQTKLDYKNTKKKIKETLTKIPTCDTFFKKPD